MATPYTNLSQKLVIREAPRVNAKHTYMNSVQRFAELQPYRFEDMMQQTFNSMEMYADPMAELLGSQSIVTLPNGTPDTYQWKQRVKPRPAFVTANLESTNSTPGIRKQPFKLNLSEEWFSPGEVLTPNKKELVRVMQFEGSKYKEGAGWTYICEYVDTGDVNKFLPTQFLGVGTQWMSMFNIYGEGSAGASSVHMEGQILLQDTLGDMIRLQATESGYVEDLGVLEFQQWDCDPQTGAEVSMSNMKWMDRVQPKLFRTLKRNISNLLFYGVGDDKLSGEKNHAVRIPFGYKWQLENWSHTENYSTLSSTLIRDYIYDLFVGKMDTYNINIMFKGGLLAELAFDEALKRDTSNFIIPPNLVSRGSDPMNQEVGFQIKKWVMPGGGTIGFQRLQFPDSYVLNGMRDSETGKNLESGNLYVFNLSGELANNLKVVQRANSLKWGFTGGTALPGANSGGNLSYFDDEYSIIMRDRKSPRIDDITNCGVLMFKPI